MYWLDVNEGSDLLIFSLEDDIAIGKTYREAHKKQPSMFPLFSRIGMKTNISYGFAKSYFSVSCWLTHSYKQASLKFSVQTLMCSYCASFLKNIQNKVAACSQLQNCFRSFKHFLQLCLLRSIVLYCKLPTSLTKYSIICA